MAKSTGDHPKDLGVKIGTKKEALWSRVKKEAEILIKQSQENLMVQKEILKLAESLIAEEVEEKKKA